MPITREKLEQWATAGAAAEDEFGYAPEIGHYSYAKWKRQHSVLLAKVCVCCVVTGGHVVHQPDCPVAPKAP